MTMKLKPETQKYFENLKKEVDRAYEFANEARSKGFDPVDEVEMPLAMNMAEKVVGLISTVYPQMRESGISKRIAELEEEFGKLDPTVLFKIAEEVSEEKFCKFNSVLEAIDAGIRIGLAYQTLAVVSSPIEGYTGIEIGKRRDGKEYLVANFAGPIRSAGTTASCMGLILIDFLREKFGFAKYDPTEDEIKRVYAELSDFHERITNLQYMPTEEEALFLARHMPIQVAGDPSEKLEVSNYKNLDRVSTNYLRSGFCLVMAEGLAQKASKGFRLFNMARKNGVKSTGFDWLKDYIELHEKRTLGKGDSGDSPTYIKDLVAGRPVYGHPSESGGFRFRYGRGRNSGFSSASLHPATMGITDDFIAIGTQLKIEKPTKGCAMTVCDEIEGPIVKFKDDSVKQLHTYEEAKKAYPDVKEVIYLGDMLFPFSDLTNRNANLIKSGYVEEWWNLELNKKGFKEDINYKNVSLDKSIEISDKWKVPLYPKFIYYWNEINYDQFSGLIEWLNKSKFDKKLILPYPKKEIKSLERGKRALELLGVPHDVLEENVVINEINSRALFVNLGFDFNDSLNDFFSKENFLKKEKPVLEIVNEHSKFVIKDKSGEFIGARMGRPEKAKLRKLVGSPNILFAVGNQGGRLRSLNVAYQIGNIYSDFPLYNCLKCSKETIYRKCESCGSKTEPLYYHFGLKQKRKEEVLEGSDKKGVPHMRRSLDIKTLLNDALGSAGMKKLELPELIKGIRGTSSEGKTMEYIIKGVLRAKHGLQVNKDGTVRMDATELPLTSFRPFEIGTSISKLKELGYEKDIYGKDIMKEDQIIELMPHDVLIPNSPDTPDEKGEDVFMNVSNFVDDLLERLYGMKSWYNIKKKEDLIGKLGVCMAPHNCAGVVCRFIGFSKTLGLMASPYLHAAIRRDCFDYNTYVPIKKDGVWRLDKIGKFVEEVKPEKVVDNFGTKEKEVKGFETVGFSNGLEEVGIKNFSSHTKNTFFEIKTSLGKKIKVTENHKFFTEGKMKPASKLKIGDKLTLPRKLNIKSNNLKEINLIDYLKEENLMIRGINGVLKELDLKERDLILDRLNISKKQFVNFKLRDSYPVSFVVELKDILKERIFDVGKICLKRDNISVPIKIKLEEDLLEVIGLYVAEGYSRKVGGKKGLNQVYISSDDEFIRNFIKKTISNHFGLNPSERKKDRVTFSSGILYLFFTKILGCGSSAREKRIPSLFLDLPLKKLASVLRGYYEGDGSVSKSDRRVSCDSVSEGLLYDLEFCLSRFGIFSKRYEYEKEPGPKVRNFYLKKKRKVPFFKITKLIIGSDFVESFFKIGFLSQRKKNILNFHKNKKGYGMRIEYDRDFVYDPIVSIECLGEKESYCLKVDSDNHLVVGNSIVSKNCDGDEAAIMLLGDVLLNFSKKYLPSHRGGTQDAPLVLNARIDAGEVDDQILDLEFLKNYPLELYENAEKRMHSSTIKFNNVKEILKRGEDPFVDSFFTHDTKDFNDGIRCSSYKSLENMKEKVGHQMRLVEKLRSVDTSDTARLVIERHFIRDMRGNLRNFSTQSFRCVECNEIVRRVPLSGKCPVCGGKLIFTIHEGGIKKYLEPALELAKTYNVSPYLQQTIGLVKGYIDSIFGKELEKQETVDKWF